MDASSSQSPPQPQPGPLSPQQLKQLAKANGEAKKLKKIVSMAAFNGWSLVIAAVFCAAFAWLDPVTSLVMAVVLGVLGFVELYGRNRIMRMDPSVGRLLACNQLALLAVITIYCLWNIYAALNEPSMAQQHPEIKQVIGNIDELQSMITWGLYLTIIVVSVIYQGLCALRYVLAGRRMRDYLNNTPTWIVEIQRAGETSN